MLFLRKATPNDLMLYFQWANDSLVRLQSFNTETISIDTHAKWFTEKINDPKNLLLVFQSETFENVGQVIFQKASDNSSAIIGISVERSHRGKGYAAEMLIKASEYFYSHNRCCRIDAFIRQDNNYSIRSFERAGFVYVEKLVYKGVESVKYSKY